MLTLQEKPAKCVMTWLYSCFRKYIRLLPVAMNIFFSANFRVLYHRSYSSTTQLRSIYFSTIIFTSKIGLIESKLLHFNCPLLHKLSISIFAPHRTCMFWSTNEIENEVLRSYGNKPFILTRKVSWMEWTASLDFLFTIFTRVMLATHDILFANIVTKLVRRLCRFL